MIRYIAAKDPLAKNNHAYDICACEVQDDIIEILNTVKDISADRNQIRHLLALLNGADVDPLHLPDIIEDTLGDLVL